MAMDDPVLVSVHTRKSNLFSTFQSVVKLALLKHTHDSVEQEISVTLWNRDFSNFHSQESTEAIILIGPIWKHGLLKLGSFQISILFWVQYGKKANKNTRWPIRAPDVPGPY